MPAHPLTRGEISELAGRLHGLIDMIAVGELTACTGMTYRLQGAVSALDTVLGRDSSLLGPMFAVISQSGKSLVRRALTAALEDLDARHGDVLMVAKLDRLTRSVHDASGLMQRSEKSGWDIVALDAPVDTTTPAGRAMAQILSVFAELERRLIGERTKAALAVKRDQGVVLGRPRTLPDKVVERILRERRAGRTWTAIGEGLTADRVPTAQGGLRWYPATVRSVAMSASRRVAHSG